MFHVLMLKGRTTTFAMHRSTPNQVCPRPSGRRVLRRGRRECRAPSPQPRGGTREHGGIPRVEAGYDGGAGHAAPRADDRGGGGRSAHANRATVAVLGAFLPRCLGGVVRTVRFACVVFIEFRWRWGGGGVVGGGGSGTSG